jgi:hypothetical protein
MYTAARHAQRQMERKMEVRQSHADAAGLTWHQEAQRLRLRDQSAKKMQLRGSLWGMG